MTIFLCFFPLHTVCYAGASEASIEHDMDGNEAEFGDFGDDGNNDGNGMEEEAEATHSVECVGFSNGELRWAASGGMDNTLKVGQG
jgi:hypothetical protein